MSDDKHPTHDARDLHEFFAEDPAAADRAFFGREAYSDQGDFTLEVGAGTTVWDKRVGAV